MAKTPLKLLADGIETSSNRVEVYPSDSDRSAVLDEDPRPPASTGRGASRAGSDFRCCATWLEAASGDFYAAARRRLTFRSTAQPKTWRSEIS